MNNLTVQQLKDRIDWLLANTSLTPSSQTDIPSVEDILGVGGRELSTQASHYRDLEREVADLRNQLEEANEEVSRLESELADA